MEGHVVGGEELWQQANSRPAHSPESSDRQQVAGDELPASPRSDTALHDRAISFQVGEGGEPEGEGRTGEC